MRQLSRLLIYIFLVVILLSACTRNSSLLPISDSRKISPDNSFGQSFTALYNGLSGVSVSIAPTSDTEAGSLTFHLRENSDYKEDIAVGRLPLADITEQKYYKFDFAPQINSQGKDYFLQVDVEGDSAVQINTSEADNYLDGALYENQSPQEAQLAFQLEYERNAVFGGLIALALQWIGVLVAGIFAFIIPGWAVFSLLWNGWEDLNWPSKLGLSCGLSIAIYPVFFLWTDLVGLHLGPIYAWAPPIAGLISLGWKNRNSIISFKFRPLNKKQSNGEQVRPGLNIILADFAFVILLGLIILSRFWVIRSLEIPLFGDSYQHTMITHLIIDNRGLFDSWEPYANLSTFTYHFGFHAVSAVFYWISGVSVEKSLLWTGQLINIFAVLGLYPLTYRITKNRWSGVIAVLIGGLLSPMPMTYVNWGRYTQVAGQAILPVVIWTIWSMLDRPFPDWRGISMVRKFINIRNLSLDYSSLAVAWVAFGGLALTHYRILILVILFLPAYILLNLSRKTVMGLLGRIGWISIGGAILSLPWFVQVFGGKILKIFSIQMTALPPNVSSNTELFTGFGNLNTYLPMLIWILTLLCIAWGLWKQKKDIAVFTGWWFIILLATNPQWIGLPGSGVITNFAVLIAFYIPASVIIGSSIDWIPITSKQPDGADTQLNQNRRSIYMFSSVLLIVICFLGIVGLKTRKNDIDISTYELVTRPDFRAMEWIKENTAEEGIFLVNSFFAYDNTAVVGSDGGWWIPLLADRKTTLPPLTYAFEQGVGSATVESANNLTKAIQEKGITDPEIIKLLIQNSIRYIYIGQRQGTVNYTGPYTLGPEILINNPNFKVIYHQDRVWIFEIVP
jgi:hypothetical protein